MGVGEIPPGGLSPPHLVIKTWILLALLRITFTKRCECIPPPHWYPSLGGWDSHPIQKPEYETLDKDKLLVLE